MRQRIPASTGRFSLLVVLLGLLGLSVFLSSKELPPWQEKLLALGGASFAGLLAFYFTGAISSSSDSKGGAKIKATGGFAVFVIVLTWWLTASKSAAPEGMYRVRVTVVGPEQLPLAGTKVWSSVGGEPKEVAGGWQFDIPKELVPPERSITFYASVEPLHLAGQTSARLGSHSNPAFEIRLAKNANAEIRGNVFDRRNGRALKDVKITVIGSGKTTLTGEDGGFKLPAGAAPGEQVTLHVESKDYEAFDQRHPAGDAPVTIYLEKLETK